MKIFCRKKKIESALSLTVNALDNGQKRFAFRLLLLVLSQQITPFEFNCLLLKKLGYAPKRRLLDRHFFILAAENLNILFKTEGNEIILNYDFTENPFPGIAAHTPVFTRGYTVETNITARQFADCTDYLQTAANTGEKDIHLYLYAKTVETLYRLNFERAKKLPFEVLFAVQMWFTGISLFFHRHPVYGILFRNAGESENTKISLGMNETLLHLQKEGYGNIDGMNLIDFFNAQIKSLKNSLLHARAEGVKIEDIAKSMQLNPETINKFI